MLYKVDVGVPMPKPRTKLARMSKYPFDTMEVGDSFEVPLTEPDAAAQAARLSNDLRTANKILVPKFARRTAPDGLSVRVWRIK